MADVEQNQGAVEDQEGEDPHPEESQKDHSEKSLLSRKKSRVKPLLKPSIGVAVVVIVAFTIWFLNTPSYEPLIGVLMGLAALISANPKKDVKYDWLLVGVMVVVAVVGIALVRQANDPDEIIIVGIFYDGVEAQEGDEYVIIRNEDTQAVQLEGWTLNDNLSNHVFTFPRYEIQPGEECRIYTNEDHPDWCGFNFRNGGSGVWNNKGDMATLRNAEGIIIDSSIDFIFTPDGEPAESSTEATTDTDIVLTPTLTNAYDELDCIPRDTPREVGRVVDVIDGRTIDVELEDGTIVRVRYLGIATIVKGQPLFEQSVEINRDFVLDETVTLVKDPEVDDPEDILLRYVFVGDSFVNFELIVSGYAVLDSVCSCEGIFEVNTVGAYEADRGFTTVDDRLFGDPFRETPPAGNYEGKFAVIITEVFYDGEAGELEPDEYIEILNDGVEGLQLKDWTLSDEQNHVFTFPDFILEPGQHCRIYTNELHSDGCSFNYENKQPIWGNKGDCATLRDSEGLLIGQVCY